MSAALQDIAQRIVLLSGWRRMAAAVMAGAIGSLAMAPVDFLFALAIALPAAVWLIDGAVAGPDRLSPRALFAAFLAGWGFGFGYFLGGLWWLGAAFLVEDDQFAWALPFGVLGLPAALALFHGAGFALARLFWSTGGRRIFAFSAAMAAAEFLRGFLFTGFPWNSIGQAMGAYDATSQAASVVGLDGLTVIALILFSAPALAATGETRAARLVPPMAAAMALAAMAAFGAWRLQTTTVTSLPDVRIRIMQPNLGQREKHRLSGQEVLSRYLRLSDKATTPATRGAADVTHLVWPESPFPFLLAREPQALAQIAGLLRPRTTLITGAARAEDAGGDSRRTLYFNAIHVVGSDGVIADSYDKVHLVPFGEYLPFRAAFDAIGVRQFIEIPGGFEAGARRKALSVPGLPAVIPLICYEAIFPGEAAAEGRRAGLIINVTNDAWFGLTAGPHQHLAQARMRSIEQGLPQLRAANTGISAIIDPLGRILQRLPLGSEGVIDAQAPAALPPTPFAKHGAWAGVVLMFACFLLCLRRETR